MWPDPVRPQCTTREPMASNGPLMCDRALGPASQPAINVSVPASAPGTAPPTGASANKLCFASAAAHTRLAVPKSMVEQSMNVTFGPTNGDSSNPPAEQYISSTVAGSGSIVKTTECSPFDRSARWCIRSHGDSAMVAVSE